MSLKKQPEQFNPNSGTNNDTTNTIQEDEGIQENSSKKQPEQCDANSVPKIENNINNYSTMNVNQADVLYQTCPGSINQTIYVKTVNQNQSPNSTWITTCSSMILLISILISIIIIIIILISIYFSKSENQLQNNKPPIHNFSVNNITPLAQVENLSFSLDEETLNRIKKWAFEATEKTTEDSPQKYYQLGYMSYKGIGTEKNLKTATEYLEKAKENPEAKIENPEAKILLAKIYEKEEEKANELYKEALDEFQNLAIQDNIEAKIYLWYMYKNGLGGKKELDKAKKWYLEIVQGFEKIYKEDSENTKKNLDIYYKNRNEDNNKSSDYLTTQKIRYRHLNLDQEELEELKKIEFYVVQKNAIEDNTKAKYDLYYMYKMGIGIKQNDEKIEEWWEKAKNNPQAGESSLYLYRLEPDFTTNNVDNYLQCFAKIEDIETLIYLYAKNINNIKERDKYTKMIKGQFIKDAKEYYQYSKNKLNQQEKDKIQNIEEDTIDNFYVFLINLWKIYALGSEEDEEQAKYWYNRVINCLYENVESEDKFSEKALFYLGKIFNIKINIESDNTRKEELQKTIDEYKLSDNKENAIVQYYCQVIDHLFRDEKSKSKDDAKKHVNEIITSLKKKDNGISQYNLGLLYYNLIEQELKKAFNDLKKTFLDNQRDEGNFKKIYYDESENALEDVCKWIKENDENKDTPIEIPLKYIKLSYTEIVEDTIKHVLNLFKEFDLYGSTDAELQFKLGELFLYYNVHKDIKEAYESFKKSTYDKVELNTKRKEDLNNAFNWFELSAENGNADAQYMLGMHYYRREDSTNALYWLKKSADNGNADAQYELGELDSTNALYWLKKSAYQGNIDARGKIILGK